MLSRASGAHFNWLIDYLFKSRLCLHGGTLNKQEALVCKKCSKFSSKKYIVVIFGPSWWVFVNKVNTSKSIIGRMLVHLFVVPCRLVTSSPCRFQIWGKVFFFSKLFFPILLEVNFNYIFVFEKLIYPLRFESCRVTRRQADKARRINALA